MQLYLPPSLPPAVSISLPLSSLSLSQIGSAHLLHYTTLYRSQTSHNIRPIQPQIFKCSCIFLHLFLLLFPSPSLSPLSLSPRSAAHTSCTTRRSTDLKHPIIYALYNLRYSNAAVSSSISSSCCFHLPPSLLSLSLPDRKSTRLALHDALPISNIP